MKSRALYIGPSRDDVNLWQALQDDFLTDLLEVKLVDGGEERREASVTLEASQGKGWWLPSSIFRFSDGELRKFRERMLEKQYDYLILATTASALLAFECERVSPQTKVVVDARGEGAVGRKGRRFERRLYRRPYLFLCSSADRCGDLVRRYGKGTAPSRFIDPSLGLTKEITGFQPGRIRLGIVANRLYPDPGRAAMNVFLQARDLARSGCAVTVYTPKRIESASVEFIDGVRVKRLWNLSNPFSVYPTNLARTFCPALLWHLLRERFDVVQSYPAPHYNAMAALAIQRLLGKLAVLVSFDLRDYAALIREEGGAGNLLTDYEPILRERLAFEWHDHVFAVANKEVKFIRKYTDDVSALPLPASVEDHTDPEESPLQRYGIDKETFVFLCAGRLSHARGQDIAIRAFDEALPQLGNAKLILAGRQDFEPGFSEELQEYVQAHGLAESILFTGAVERQELLAWLRHSDVHVVPARLMNSAVSIVESWLSGTPVIQSDAVDPNLVIDGENGFLFKTQSIEDLAETLIRAKESSASYLALAEAGKALVQEQHSFDCVTNHYVALYRELMGAQTSNNHG